MVTTMSRQEYIEMYNIIGACMEVFNEVGRGMAEPIYQEMVEIELNKRGIKYEREKVLKIQYKDIILKKEYIADFIINDVILELKSVDEIKSEHRSQLFNYMRITGLRRGLLINFGELSLHTERYLYQDQTDNFALINQENLHNYVRE